MPGTTLALCFLSPLSLACSSGRAQGRRRAGSGPDYVFADDDEPTTQAVLQCARAARRHPRGLRTVNLMRRLFAAGKDCISAVMQQRT